MVPPVVLLPKEMSVRIDPNQPVKPFVEDADKRPRTGGVIFALVAGDGGGGPQRRRPAPLII